MQRQWLEEGGLQFLWLGVHSKLYSRRAGSRAGMGWLAKRSFSGPSWLAAGGQFLPCGLHWLMGGRALLLIGGLDGSASAGGTLPGMRAGG